MRRQIQQIEELKQYIEEMLSRVRTENNEIVSAVYQLRREGLYVEIVEKFMSQYLSKIIGMTEEYGKKRKKDWADLDEVQRRLEKML